MGPRIARENGVLAQSVEEMARMEGRDQVEMSRGEHLATLLTRFSGSMLFVWLHTAWFLIWILLNAPPFELHRFDPFPFGLLTMVVSLEAIFLSTFVLIAENRQALRADRRARV